MIALAAGLRVYLACGVTDMRNGMMGLSVEHDWTDHADLGAAGCFAGRMRVAGAYITAATRAGRITDQSTDKMLAPTRSDRS